MRRRRRGVCDLSCRTRHDARTAPSRPCGRRSRSGRGSRCWRGRTAISDALPGTGSRVATRSRPSAVKQETKPSPARKHVASSSASSGASIAVVPPTRTMSFGRARNPGSSSALVSRVLNGEGLLSTRATSFATGKRGSCGPIARVRADRGSNRTRKSTSRSDRKGSGPWVRPDRRRSPRPISLFFVVRLAHLEMGRLQAIGRSRSDAGTGERSTRRVHSTRRHARDDRAAVTRADGPRRTGESPITHPVRFAPGPQAGETPRARSPATRMPARTA